VNNKRIQSFDVVIGISTIKLPNYLIYIRCCVSSQTHQSLQFQQWPAPSHERQTLRQWAVDSLESKNHKILNILTQGSKNTIQRWLFLSTIGRNIKMSIWNQKAGTFVCEHVPARFQYWIRTKVVYICSLHTNRFDMLFYWMITKWLLGWKRTLIIRFILYSESIYIVFRVNSLSVSNWQSVTNRLSVFNWLFVSNHNC